MPELLAVFAHGDAACPPEKADKEVFGGVAGARGHGADEYRRIGQKPLYLVQLDGLYLLKDRVSDGLSESLFARTARVVESGQHICRRDSGERI